MIEAASSIPTNQPYREFLTFIHNLVSTSFKWTPHAKAHSIAEGAEKFALTKIRIVPRILVAAPGSRFVDMQHPNELTPDDCLAYSGESRRENWVLSDGGSSMTISAGRAFSANNGEVLADMAADGSGVAMLPNFHVSEHLRTGRLMHVFKGWAPPDLWLTLYYPPYQALPPRIASFSKFFEEQVAAQMVMLD